MRRSLLAAIPLLFLTACSSSSTPAATATPTPSGIPAADMTGPAAIAAVLFPDSGTACGHSGDYSPCPITPELKVRLAARPLQYVDQLCRCTGVYRSPKFTVTPFSSQTVVRVDLGLDSGTQSLDLIVTHPQGAWVASDVLCAGRGTSTSVFSDAPTLCFSSG